MTLKKPSRFYLPSPKAPRPIILIVSKSFRFNRHRFTRDINDDVESRLNELERLLFNSSIKDQTVLGVEALLDAFIVLYDECCNSTLRREKTIAEFIEHG